MFILSLAKRGGVMMNVFIFPSIDLDLSSSATFSA